MKKSVALKYLEGTNAPFITAKGTGLEAEKILLEAEKNNIPIEEDTALVELLENQNVGDEIPESAWKSVALIFSYILNRENNDK